MGRGTTGEACAFLRGGSSALSPILSAAAIAVCWSWIGIELPAVSAVVPSGGMAGGAASLTLVALNVALFAICALVRVLCRCPGLVSRCFAWAFGLLAAFCAAVRLLGLDTVFPLLFGALVLTGSLVVTYSLCAALDLLSTREGSPVPVLASAFAASAMLSAAALLLPGGVRALCWFFMAGLSWFLARFGGGDDSPHGRAPCSPAALKPLVRLAAGSFLYGFVGLGMWYMTIGRSDLSSRDEATVVQSLAICLVFLVVVAVDRFSASRGRRLLESAFQRLVFAAYVIGAMVFALAFRASPAWPTLLVMSATALFEMTLFYWAVDWGRSVAHGATACLAVLLGSLMLGQLVSWWCLGGPLHVLIEAADPMVLGYACLALMLPAALAVFIPMDIGRRGEVAEAPSAPGAPGRPESQGTSCEQGPHPAFLDFCSRYGLSPRESQVAELLVAGRSLPYIQEALAISEGTAKTHLRHIYEKTGTHRRQDFLSLAQKNNLGTHV